MKKIYFALAALAMAATAAAGSLMDGTTEWKDGFTTEPAEGVVSVIPDSVVVNFNPVWGGFWTYNATEMPIPVTRDGEKYVQGMGATYDNGQNSQMWVILTEAITEPGTYTFHSPTDLWQLYGWNSDAPVEFTFSYTVDPNVGIGQIEGQNAEAVYYDLAGRRVAQPENGVFVRVQGGKATKVVR